MAQAITSDASRGQGVLALVAAFATRYRLSQRETAVLALAADGLHRKEAAHRLGCSAWTVDTYWRRILKKTQRGSQSELFAALLAFATGDRRPRPSLYVDG
jgi:DNA-binding CsgD family transcriptional regulator